MDASRSQELTQADTGPINRLFRYLSSDGPGQPPAVTDLTPADCAFVFGRKDARVAQTTAALWPGVVKHVLVTGGIGKDAGNLTSQGHTEASWLFEGMIMLGVNSNAITLEEKATNGGENCRFGLDAIDQSGARPNSIIVVAHATSLRRLATMLRDELKFRGWDIPVQAVPTNYPFDASNPTDHAEAIAELNRLVNWPDKVDTTTGRPFLSRQAVPDEFLALL